MNGYFNPGTVVQVQVRASAVYMGRSDVAFITPTLKVEV
jgi:hypothetical protein